MNTCRICNLEYPKIKKGCKDRCSKCYNKQYRQDNQERLTQYREQNKEKRNQNKREWSAKNKQHIKEYNNTYIGKKAKIVNSWKKYGLLEYGYTYNELYDYYLECNNCEVCGKDLSGNQQKCMDHCHQDGCFRWILCASCNTMDSWMKKI